jgi:hypothetical protein
MSSRTSPSERRPRMAVHTLDMRDPSSRTSSAATAATGAFWPGAVHSLPQNCRFYARTRISVPVNAPVCLQRSLVPSIRGPYRGNTGIAIGDSFDTSCRPTRLVTARVVAGKFSVVAVLPHVSTLARVLRLGSWGSHPDVLLARLWGLLGDLGHHAGDGTGHTTSPSALRLVRHEDGPVPSRFRRSFR